MKADAEFLERGNRAFVNNRDPILKVLQRVLPQSGPKSGPEPGIVFEVGSGVGNHAHYFAARLPGLIWRPSDPDSDNCAAMEARMKDAPANLQAPAILDARADKWPVRGASAVVAINVVHIMPWEGTQGLIKGAAKTLRPGGLLFLYGAYKQGGRFVSKNDEDFDKSLRGRNPEWGLRDLDDVTLLARQNGLEPAETVAMPNNNLCVAFKKS